MARDLSSLNRAAALDLRPLAQDAAQTMQAVDATAQRGQIALAQHPQQRGAKVVDHDQRKPRQLGRGEALGQHPDLVAAQQVALEG
jgi:hypothetical protein